MRIDHHHINSLTITARISTKWTDILVHCLLSQQEFDFLKGGGGDKLLLWWSWKYRYKMQMYQLQNVCAKFKYSYLKLNNWIRSTDSLQKWKE
jgi:hypothetical protein